MMASTWPLFTVAEMFERIFFSVGFPSAPLRRHREADVLERVHRVLMGRGRILLHFNSSRHILFGSNLYHALGAIGRLRSTGVTDEFDTPPIKSESVLFVMLFTRTKTRLVGYGTRDRVVGTMVQGKIWNIMEN